MGHVNYNGEDELGPILEDLAEVDMEWSNMSQAERFSGGESPTYETIAEMAVDIAHSYSPSPSAASGCSADTQAPAKRKGRKRAIKVANPDNAERCRKHREEEKERHLKNLEQVSMLELRNADLTEELNYKQENLDKAIAIIMDLIKTGKLGIM